MMNFFSASSATIDYDPVGNTSPTRCTDRYLRFKPVGLIFLNYNDYVPQIRTDLRPDDDLLSSPFPLLTITANCQVKTEQDYIPSIASWGYLFVDIPFPHSHLTFFTRSSLVGLILALSKIWFINSRRVRPIGYIDEYSRRGVPYPHPLHTLAARSANSAYP